MDVRSVSFDEQRGTQTARETSRDGNGYKGHESYGRTGE